MQRYPHLFLCAGRAQKPQTSMAQCLFAWTRPAGPGGQHSQPIVLRQRGSESAYRLAAPMYRDLVRIREGAPLEASLLGPSADVVVTRHEPTYVLEVATCRYDRRRLGARQAKHCVQPFSSVSVTLVKNTREKRERKE